MNASIPVPTVDQIRQSTDALGAIGVLTEQKFLAIGDRVERAVAILGHLSTTFEALLAEMRSGAVLQSRQNIALAAIAAKRLADAPGSEATGLQQLAKMTEAINARINAMRNIARDVDTLAINARLIAAGMGTSGGDFMDFAAEIRRSAQLALIGLAQIGEALANAGRHLDAARSGVTTYVERHGATLLTIPDRLAVAVATITARDDMAANATTAIAARTADVRLRVASMIVELQLGDVTRQRIEHMQDAAGTLLCLATPADALLSEWRMLSTDEIAALLQIGCNLVEAQLHDTAGQLDSEAERVADGLDRLAVDARDISCLAAQAYGAVDQDHRGFMTELEVDLRETAVMFDDLRAAREDTECRITSVLGIANRLTENIDTLRGLEGDIRIMGLNTTLKCGRLGALGRPLSVIAQTLRDYGGRTAIHAEAALIDLKLLAEHAGRFSGSREALLDVAGGDFMQQLLSAVDLLGHTGQTLSAALVGLDADSGAASRLLQEAALDFSVRRDVAAVLHGSAEALGQIAAQQVGRSITDATAKERLLARFAAVYTMAREREVHARSGGSVVQQSTVPDESDLADVLF